MQNTATKTTMTRSAETCRRESFGVADEKGRGIGAIAHLCTAEFTPTDSDLLAVIMTPGVYFYADVQTARDNYKHGAWQSGRYFTTEAERDAYVTKRIESIRRNAIKRFAAA